MQSCISGCYLALGAQSEIMKKMYWVDCRHQSSHFQCEDKVLFAKILQFGGIL